MTDNAVVVFICTGIFALLALLILVPTPRQLAKILPVRELRRDLDQLLASTRNIERTLEQHRRVLNDAHKQISAVTKGLEKRPS